MGYGSLLSGSTESAYNGGSMIRIVLVFTLSSLLTACGGVSEVVKTGKDTYMVASSDTTIGSGGGNLKVKLYKAASKFCEDQSKVLMPVSTSSIDWAIGRPASAELVFRCLLEGDPDLQRPEMKPVPNIVIQK
jgi:hypothetical protein